MSSDGKLIAVGCKNGRVFLIDPNSLKTVNTIAKVVNPDKEILSVVKFAPNSEILAIGYAPPISQIHLYNIKNNQIKLMCEMKGSPSRISYLDFSQDSKYIQCNNTSFEILYFNQTGKQETSGATLLKDESWFTFNCIYGWPVQGIWQPCNNGIDIKAVDRCPQNDVLATADEYGKVKLFKYPSCLPRAACNKYNGHSSFVTNCRFSKDGLNLISIGGEEKSIFQWKFNHTPSSHGINTDHIEDTPNPEEHFNNLA